MLWRYDGLAHFRKKMDDKSSLFGYCVTTISFGKYRMNDVIVYYRMNNKGLH